MKKSSKSRASRKGSRVSESARFILTPLAAGILTATQAPAQELEEIVVTATRRAQTVLDIPYNISAFSEEDLNRARTATLSDLTRLVSGLFTIDQGPGVRGANNNFVLRGLNAQSGTNQQDFPHLSDPTVSTYLGETPVFFPLTIKDIERVEVLRGPQGTLYGASSAGGTIRFIPNRPDTGAFTVDASSDISFTDASDEVSYGFDAVVNVPLATDRAALRIAAGYEELGGFIDANGLVATEGGGGSPGEFPGRPVPRVADDLASGFVLDPRKDTNDYDNWYARVSVLWQPNDNLEALLSYHHEESSQDDLQGVNQDFMGCICDNSVPQFPGSFFENVAGIPGGAYPNGATMFPGNDGDYAHNKVARSPYEDETDVVSAEINVNFGFATFTSASSYFDTKTDYLRVDNGFYEIVPDPDNINLAYLYGYYPRLMGLDRDVLSKDGFSQEVRLASDWDKRIDFVVGAYYQDTDFEWFLDAEFPGFNEFDQEVLGGYGFNPQLPNKVFAIDFDTTFENFAVFGEVTFRITEQWQVTGGMRAFWQDFEAELVQTVPFCGPYCANDGEDLLGTTAVGPIGSDFEDQLFKVNTSYDISDAMMVYFTWAEGFRRGGANPFPTGGFYASLPEFLTYDPDEVTNYEAGIKGRLADNVTYSLAGYYIDWNNFQFDETTPAGQLGVFNGSEARSIGVELEANGRITEQLRFNLGYSYTDAEITEDFVIRDLVAFGGVFTNTVEDSIAANDGDNLPNVPKHSFTGGLDFEQPVMNNWFLNWHVDTSFRSKSQSTFNRDVLYGRNYFEPDSFFIWNASVTLDAGKWSASIYGRNLFSEEGITGGTPPGFSGNRSAYEYVTRPRTIGLALSYSYN